MRMLSVFRKEIREQTRSPWLLIMTLLTAPSLVLLYWLFFGGGGSTTYAVLVLNHDQGVTLADGSALVYGEGAIDALEMMAYADGQSILNVILVTDRAEAETQLRDRDAHALVIIPADFSQVIHSVVQGSEQTADATTSLILSGDLTNPYYAVAAIMANAALEDYVQVMSGQQRPVLVAEEPLGGSAARTEFETYVPGLFIFAVIMLIFPAAMTVAREAEAGTLRRLQLTRMTALDFLGGISAAQVLLGVLTVLLTFLTAQLLGFHSQGPLWVAAFIGAVTSFSIVGAGLLVAAFSKTVTEAFVIANFPLMLFMFFSGAVFPLPPLTLFSIGERAIGLFDFLPPAHAVVALNKVLTLGAGLGDVLYELAALIVLSVAYFIIGVWLFQRRHMRAG